MFNQKKRAMKLTQNEINLYRSIAIAIFRTYLHKKKICNEKIKETARRFSSTYNATPSYLEEMVDLYSSYLDCEEANAEYLRVLEIFLEMKEDELNFVQ